MSPAAPSSNRKPIEYEPSDLHIEGNRSGAIPWAEFARDNEFCFIRPNRWMLFSLLACTGLVGFFCTAAAWAVNKWIEDSDGIVLGVVLVGMFTVTLMLAISVTAHFILRKRGPWLAANLRQRTLYSRLVNESWSLEQVEGLVVVEGYLSATRRDRIQQIKVIVGGKPHHAYSQTKSLSHDVLKLAQKFGAAIDVPVQHVSLHPKPKLFGVEIG